MIVIAKITHAAPAELEVAATTAHVRTAFVFFDAHTTPWTSSHVVCECKTSEGTLLNVLALTPMPRLLAFEAGEIFAVRALDLVGAASLFDFLFAAEMRTKDHFVVQIDLSRQA